ncbi:MAG: tetratricopeptide repeat protein [Gemmatimonadota bacterium]
MVLVLGSAARHLRSLWRRSPGIDAVVLVLCLGAFVLHCRQYEVVQDDAYISFAHAKNLVLGNGLVIDPGERVEGYTNFLWTLLCALPILAGTDVARFAQVLGCLSAVGLFLAAWVLAGALRPRRPAWSRAPVLALLAANGALAFWTLSGMETALFALLVTLGAAAYVTELRTGTPRWHTGVLFGLAALTRPEGLFFFGLTVGHRLALQVRARRVDLRAHLPSLLPFLAMAAPHFAFRLLYYGYPLPNTFYAKTGLGLEYLADGLSYSVKFVVDYGFWGLGLAAPLLLMVWRRQRAAHAYLALLVLGNAAYVTAAGGDTMAENRLFLPVLALVYVELQELGYRLANGARRALPRAFAWAPGSAGLALLALAAAYTGLHARPQLEHARLATRAHNGKLYDLVAYIRTFPDPGKLLVASTAIGIPRYFTDAAVLDLVGLTDATIAHDPQPLPGIRSNHRLRNYNVQYVMDRAPDLIYFITGERPATPAEKALFMSRRFRQGYYMTYVADDRPVYAWRGPSGPGTVEDLAPTGDYVELYAGALGLCPAAEAMDLFRQCISRAPHDFAYAHTWLGREHYDRDEIQPATDLFEQALAIDGQVVTALAHLSILRDLGGHGNEALALAARAVLLAPRSHFSNYAYGRALLSVGRTDEAVAALLEALRLSGTAPSAPDAGFALGVAMYRRGDAARARMAWEAVLRADPNHAGSRDGLRLLGAGSP